MTSSPIVLALDTDDLAEALAWSKAAGDAVGLVKVGLELFDAHGPDAVRALVGEGRAVMLDLKLHDIPVQVGAAADVLSGLGVELLTIHASGGRTMLEAAVTAVAGRCDLAAVTVLTSLSGEDLAALGFPQAGVLAERLAGVAAAAGCTALVCSPSEVASLRAVAGPGVRIICPGIRPAGSEAGDQARIATPAAAIEAGADLLVIGRPITGARDPAGAAAAILESIGGPR